MIRPKPPLPPLANVSRFLATAAPSLGTMVPSISDWPIFRILPYQSLAFPAAKVPWNLVTDPAVKTWYVTRECTIQYGGGPVNRSPQSFEISSLALN